MEGVWDATHILDHQVQVYEGDPLFESHVFARLEEQGFNGWSFRMPGGCGTHLDAPYHFGGVARIHEIPLGHLMGTCVVLSEGRWEDEARRVLDGVSFVVYRTQHCKKWGTPDYMKAWSGIPIELARMCVAAGTVKGVMIDTPSADSDGSHDFPVHNLLLAEKGIWIAENLKLDWSEADAPPTGVPLRALVMPLNLRDAPEAPARIVLTWTK